MTTDLREIQGTARDPIGYVETIDSLVAILATANYADSDQAVGWLRPGDALQHDGLYGDIWNALVRVAGQAFVDHLGETGEAEISLARRDSDVVDEFHAYHECPACEYSTGPDGVLGTLGRTTFHVRCRACGITYTSDRSV